MTAPITASQQLVQSVAVGSALIAAGGVGRAIIAVQNLSLVGISVALVRFHGDGGWFATQSPQAA